MTDNGQLIFARNLICICVDGNENVDYQGMIWHQYSDEPLNFTGVLQMLKVIDELMDEWDFPQKGLMERSLVNKKTPSYVPRDDQDELLIDKIQSECGTRNIQDKRGKKATFIVQISFRQKATWQGQVICAEADEKKDFQSAMELLRIMDNYI